jgi:hypothetical protein
MVCGMMPRGCSKGGGSAGCAGAGVGGCDRDVDGLRFVGARALEGC